ncbi:MAG: PASTA domain-containing protein [bacterium]
MTALIRRLAQRLRVLPLWIKIPVVIMQAVVLLVLFTWLYFTRSVSTIEVPDVTGQSLPEARQRIRGLDLSIRVIRKNSMNTPENHVIRQIPQPGSRIKETRRVDLYVSQGPEYVTVPDLRGETLISAKNYLYRRSGTDEEVVGSLLNLGSISRVYSTSLSRDRILLQNPQPGLEVVRGSQVDLLVSKGHWPRRTIVPDVKGKNLKRARGLLKEKHLKVGNLSYQLETDKPASVILEQNPPSGRIVSRDQPISLTVNLSETAEVAPRRYTFIRVTPPLSLEDGRLKVRLNDRRGSRIVYNEMVKPGKEVTFLVSVRGPAKLIIYWNGEIYRFRRLEYQR